MRAIGGRHLPARRPPARIRLPRAAAALLLAVLLAAGCGSLSGEPPDSNLVADSTCCPQADTEWHLEYLGVGGWLLRHRGSALMTAPMFSNPGILDVVFGRIEPDTQLIDTFLPPADDVHGILVGHGHYDHLMDVPWIARNRTPAARIYGSRTTVHTLMGDSTLAEDRLVDVESIMGTYESPGEWIELPGGGIRFMALQSEHAPHYMNHTFWDGHLDEPLGALPERASGWLEGRTLAFLIDLLDADGEPIYRIHYQDAAATPPDGFPPPLPDRKPVDMMIVCVPGAEEADGYPESIVGHLEPGTVLLGHWEDFFRPRTEPLRESPGTRLDPFLWRLEPALPPGGQWIMPEPGDTVRVAR